jgi:hypothetical protein
LPACLGRCSRHHPAHGFRGALDAPSVARRAHVNAADHAHLRTFHTAQRSVSAWGAGFGDETDATVEMVRQHMVFKDTPKMRVAKLKRFMARPTFDDELELHRVDCESSHRMLDNYEFLLRKREEFAHEPIIPPPLVRGEDLMALGLKPGPKFGEILEAVETRQLEGMLRTREEALEWVKREYAPTN